MIEVRAVSKSFGKVPALRDVSLSIRRGERIAFVGPNGSGKTTLLRAMLGLVRVEGAIFIDGADVSTTPELALRRVAYVPQIAPPIEAPLAEVVRAFAAVRDLDPAAVAACSEKLGIEIARFAKTRFRDLSGGTKQKVLAAMALSTRAEVLVCDEPSANLDAASRAVFFDLLAERGADSVLLLCSHHADEVHRLVGRVVELDEGRVARDESLAESIAAGRHYRVFVSLRFGATEIEADLRSRGFSALGCGSFVGLCSQAEKIDVLSAIGRAGERSVVDVHVERAPCPPSVGSKRPRSLLQVVT